MFRILFTHRPLALLVRDAKNAEKYFWRESLKIPHSGVPMGTTLGLMGMPIIFKRSFTSNSMLFSEYSATQVKEMNGW